MKHIVALSGWVLPLCADSEKARAAADCCIVAPPNSKFFSAEEYTYRVYIQNNVGYTFTCKKYGYESYINYFESILILSYSIQIKLKKNVKFVCLDECFRWYC